MRILETLLISQTPEIFEEVTSGLPFRRQEFMGLEAYRLEIDDDLAMLLYHLPFSESLPLQMMEQIQPYLQAILLVVHGKMVEENPFSGTDYEQWIMDMGELPVEVAVRMEMKNLNYLNDIIREEGLYLSEQGNIIFWHPLLKPSQLNVWKALWAHLPQSEPQE